jgi:hypothetical protein
MMRARSAGCIIFGFSSVHRTMDEEAERTTTPLPYLFRQVIDHLPAKDLDLNSLFNSGA